MDRFAQARDVMTTDVTRVSSETSPSDVESPMWTTWRHDVRRAGSGALAEVTVSWTETLPGVCESFSTPAPATPAIALMSSAAPAP